MVKRSDDGMEEGGKADRVCKFRNKVKVGGASPCRSRGGSGGVDKKLGDSKSDDRSGNSHGD
jgi:hypothetical protein